MSYGEGWSGWASVSTDKNKADSKIYVTFGVMVTLTKRGPLLATRQSVEVVGREEEA